MLRQPSLDQPVAMGLFHAQLDDFLAKAKEGIQRGEIPRTPINSRVVTDLGAMVRHIFDPNTTQGLMNDLVPSLKDMIAKFEIGDRLALRPEATASVVRAYIEHGMQTRPGNVKLYYMGPMFRRERPQKGRYRQFYQIGAELLGPSDHAGDRRGSDRDAAGVFRAREIARRDALHQFHRRQELPAGIRRNAARRIAESARDSWARTASGASRRIRCACWIRNCRKSRPIIETLPRIADHLCDDCREHYAQAQAATGAARYRVRGKLAAGARARLLHAHDVRDHGAGAGFAERGVRRRALRRVGGIAGRPGDDERDRVRDRHGPVDAVAARGGGERIAAALEVFVAWFGAATYPAAVALARKLRERESAVELPAQ